MSGTVSLFPQFPRSVRKRLDHTRIALVFGLIHLGYRMNELEH